MKRVLIADDHAVTRRGLREIVRELVADAEVDEAADGDSVLQRIDTQCYELLLVDVMMPGPGIVGLLEGIRARQPELPVLVLTASTEMEFVVESLRAGANGLVHKHQADTELVQAIERVAGGGQYLHADVAAQLTRSLGGRPSDAQHRTLSPRELDVLCRIARGQAMKEIAFEMGVSGKTAATYLARIRAKTGLSGHVDMARYALQHKLVD